jgi:glycosyltransferase involved in cell wall biosynthesis
MRTNKDAPPFVSVIIPVYNDQSGIDRCLEALAAQSYRHDRYEIIVIDNKSNPPIYIDVNISCNARLAVCNKVGSYAARNMGITESRGEICAFIDADCVPRNDWIERGVAALLVGHQKSIVGGDVMLNLPENTSTTALYQYLAGFPQLTNVTERGFAATANFFAHRHHFDCVGLFNTGLLSGGDLDWCYRAAQHGIQAVFCEAAIVMTSPRKDLYSAILQARRVAGGRFLIRRSAVTSYARARLQPHRKPLAAIGWILKQRELPLTARLRMLFVASLIKLAQQIEMLRLRLGGKPERR